eukprot:gene33539-44912_t
MGLGIHAHEQAPQRVLVDIRLDCVYPSPPSEDRIAEALDYDAIYTGVRALAASRHFNLQETLCEEIAALCLADPRVVRVTVRSCKLDIFPDARPLIVRRAAVEIFHAEARRREDVPLAATGARQRNFLATLGRTLRFARNSTANPTTPRLRASA